MNGFSIAVSSKQKNFQCQPSINHMLFISINHAYFNVKINCTKQRVSQILNVCVNRMLECRIWQNWTLQPKQNSTIIHFFFFFATAICEGKYGPRNKSCVMNDELFMEKTKKKKMSMKYLHGFGTVDSMNSTADDTFIILRNQTLNC